MTGFDSRVLACVMAVGLLAGAAVAVNIATVPVGNPGNSPDTRYETPGYGSVDYTYNIGKYEVTVAQYGEFLNAVAATDTHGLYNPEMWSETYGFKIQRNGVPGSYTYSVAGDWADRPIERVSWGDAARFTNWLHNSQPSGLQDVNTTEDGSYLLNGATSDQELMSVVRRPTATWVIPTEDEWYKAAYYDWATDSYYDYPTSSNSLPGRDTTEETNPGNNANYWPSPIEYYYSSVVGQFYLSNSPYGTFDQGGNAHEWTETIVGTSDRVDRGGGHGSTSEWMHAANRYGRSPTTRWFGFRVAEVPEPATITLLAFGVIGVLFRRRGPAR